MKSETTTGGLKELLIQEGHLDEESAEHATERAEKDNETFLEAIMGLGFVAETDIVRTLLKNMSLPYIDASRYYINKELFKHISMDMAKKYKILPLDVIGNTFIVGICDYVEKSVIDTIRKSTGLRVQPYITSFSVFMSSLRALNPGTTSQPDNE